jgi:transposase-like protein
LNQSQPRSAAHLKRFAAGYASKGAIPASAQGPTTAEEERIKALEREVRELRKANEILRLASAFFAQAELGRHFKP